MSDEELTASEMDDLLRELEAKAAKNDPKPAKSEEAPPTKKPKTKTKTAPKPAPKAPKEAPEAPLEKTEPKKKSKKSKKDVSVVEKEVSPGLRRFGAIAKWSIIIFPVLLAIWLLGTYLSNWVSAGWLVGLVAAVAITLTPYAIQRAIQRGSYPLWAGLTSVLLVAGLTAPMLPTAADNIGKFGHWPTTTISEVAGFPQQGWLTQTGATVALWLSKTLYPAPQTPVPTQLGTTMPLTPTEDTTPKVEPKTDGEEIKPDAPTPDSPSSDQPKATESDKETPEN